MFAEFALPHGGLLGVIVARKPLVFNGNVLREAYTTGSDDAFFSLDLNQNGVIDSGAELFGNYTPQPPSASPNGFIALAEFDREENGGNENGIIDAGDAVYSRLLLWQDSNHNGKSDPGEVRPLAQSGVNGISLDYQRSSRRDEYDNLFYYRSRIQVAKRSSIEHWAYDVFLVPGLNALGVIWSHAGLPIGGPVSLSEATKMTKQILTATILLLTLFSYAAAQSRTGGFKDSNPRQTLEGLRQIGLIIKYGQVDGRETAMQPTILQKLRDHALNRLRQGEVPLLQATDEANMVGRPRLVFTLTLKKQTAPAPAVLIEGKLLQRVRLWRDPSQEMELATWRMNSLAPSLEIETLFAFFDKPLDAFIGEYRAANPNPPRTESLTTDPPARLIGNANALQGLTGIDPHVTLRFIQFVDSRLQALADPLQREAESKLKEAGIPILRYAPDSARAGYPLLHVVVTLDQTNSYAAAIDVRTQFWQRVLALRELRKYTYLPTWELHADDGPEITEEALRRIVNSQLDRFIEAYKAANSKPASVPSVKATSRN